MGADREQKQQLWHSFICAVLLHTQPGGSGSSFRMEPNAHSCSRTCGVQGRRAEGTECLEMPEVPLPAWSREGILVQRDGGHGCSV